MEPALLAVVPVLHYFAHRASIFTAERLRQFYRHWTILFFDFLFIPFDALYHLGASFRYIGPSMLSSLILAFLLHRRWGRRNATGEESHMFKGDTTVPTFAGIAHFLFFTFQLGLVITFLLSDVANVYTSGMAGILIVYAALMPVGSYSLHGTVKISDVVGAVLLAVLALLKLTPAL